MSLGPGGLRRCPAVGLGSDSAHPHPDPAEHLTLQVVPSSTLVKEGDNVTLVCEADGNPPPVFSFFKKNVRLEGTPGHLSLGKQLLVAPCALPGGSWGGEGGGWLGGGCVGLTLLCAHCLQLDAWQDVTPLADPDNGVLKLHDVNKTSSGTYRCQTLDLDDLSQIEEEVDLVVNCKREGTGPCGRPGGCFVPPAHPAPVSIPLLDIEGVRVKMEPSSTLREGDSVMLSCDAHSPVGLKYQWRDEKVSRHPSSAVLRLSLGFAANQAESGSLSICPERPREGFPLSWTCTVHPTVVTSWPVLQGGSVLADSLTAHRRAEPLWDVGTEGSLLGTFLPNRARSWWKGTSSS